MTPSAPSSAASPVHRSLVHPVVPEDVVVALTTRHLFGLQQVRAPVRLVNGEVRLDAEGGLVGVEAELDATSSVSGSRSRDAAVASARLPGSGQHPRLVFRSTSTTARTDGGWRVDGTLTARGVPVPTTLVVHPRAAGDDHVRATARVDRSAHGITAGRGLAAATSTSSSR